LRVPLSWLAEYVPIELPFEELIEVMGRNGLEVDSVRRPGAQVTGVVLARVLEVSDHPDADKLVVVRIDDGGGERTVCAGARNIRAGDLVPYARPGASLPDPSGDGAFEIGRREMRGIMSDGMLCSPMELAVAEDHSGILVLDDDTLARGEAEPGVEIHELLPLGDPVIDIEVPADRGDLHSVRGVARDLAAILDVEVAEPPGPQPDPDTVARSGVPVAIAADDGCSRYVGWILEGVEHGSAPWWMRRRLEVCGVRSLGNVVDVTNYVMLERGQPLHAFDLDALHGPEIVVRWAGDGEELRTLDGRDRTLSTDDLVIADADRAVALAGVMGGEETEVTASTRRILLESAAFAPGPVRRTSRRLGLLSEASLRFERGVDPAGCVAAAARAVELLGAHAEATDGGAEIAGEDTPTRPSIRLDTAWAARFLGLDGLSTERQAALLERAGVTARVEDGSLVATPPSWRRDLERPADLTEEIARLHGYGLIPAELPPITQRGGLTPRQRTERSVRRAVLASGFHEAQTTTFVAADALALLATEGTARVLLDNPLAKDAAALRPGLAEGLLEVARRNVGQGRDGLAIAEVGRIFHERGGPLDEVLDAFGIPPWDGPEGEELPTQPEVLGLVAYGVRQGPRWLDRDRPWTVYDLLAAVDHVVATIGPGGADHRVERRPAQHDALHPGRTAALVWAGQVIGLVGQLHPREADARDLPAQTAVGELLLGPLWAHHLSDEPPLRRARAIVRHPALRLDLAVVVDEDVPLATVEDALADAAGELLDRLQWFDEYRGEQVGEGRRSLAFHLRLQAPDRQLTDGDADEVIERVDAAVSDLGGTLRR
jgi:phenylalanyl-tRNA synthetase beta chain